MWSFSLVSLGLIAVVSANWKPIVGPSSSSFNKKIPFGESHTYYGNEFLSEYAGFGDDHLIVPSLAGHQSTTLLGGESLGKSVEISVKVMSNLWVISGGLTLPLSIFRTSAGPRNTPWSTRAPCRSTRPCRTWTSSHYATGCDSPITRAITPYSPTRVSVS